MTMRVFVPALLLAVGLAGCGTHPAGRPARAGAPPIRLTATLVRPTDVTLTWSDGARDVAGHVVEFATAPQGPYTVLRFAAPGETRFTHPDLMPETSFYYRVRAYAGPASRPVDVTVPGVRRADETAKDDGRWASPHRVPAGRSGRHTVRDGSTAAAPTNLRGTVMTPNGIRFTWTDNAGDEDGYLLESRPKGRPDFQVVAVIDPDVDSFGLVTLPNERVASYRVRAFAYGRSSNLASQKTGADPADRTP
jgi:hypothetical protein